MSSSLTGHKIEWVTVGHEFRGAHEYILILVYVVVHETSSRIES